MKNLIFRILNGVPKYKKDFWYNLSVHTGSKEQGYTVFDEQGNYISCKAGNRIEFTKDLEGYALIYEVTRFWKERPWSDWLYPSDCINCDLKFVGYKAIKK